LVTTKELPQNVDLYERITTLQINPRVDEKAITGLYWVGATNYVGADIVKVGDDLTLPSINKTSEIESRRCYIPTPGNIIITEDLPKDIFMSRVSEDMPYTVKLSVKTEKDSGLPKRTYEWKKSTKKVIDHDSDDIKATVSANTEEGSSYEVKEEIKYKKDADGNIIVTDGL
jgi:hypothetical protein